MYPKVGMFVVLNEKGRRYADTYDENKAHPHLSCLFRIEKVFDETESNYRFIIMRTACGSHAFEMTHVSNQEIDEI